MNLRELKTIDGNTQPKFYAHVDTDHALEAWRLLGPVRIPPRFLKDDYGHELQIKQIYVNMKKGATTVLWEDGTHTTVKLNIDTERYCPFDLYYAVCAALAKKVYGSNSRFKKIIEEKTVTQEKKGKKK